MKRLLPILLLLVGCAAGNYQVHLGAGGYVSGTPTAAQLFDSQEYDALVAANAVNQQVQADYLAGKFPTSAMPTIRGASNACEQAYTIAKAQWLAFDAALKAGGSPAEDALASAIVALNTAVTNLATAKAGQ